MWLKGVCRRWLLGLDDFEFELKTKRRIMLGILGLLATVVSILLMLIILVQRGKGGGLTGALGGMGGQSAFGAKAGDVFTRVTVFAAIIWMTCCLLIIRVFNPPTAKAATKKGAELSTYEEDESDAGIGGIPEGGVLGGGSSGIGELLDSDPALSSDPDDNQDFNPGLPLDGEGEGEGEGNAPMLNEGSPDNEFRVDPAVEESPAASEPAASEPAPSEPAPSEPAPSEPAGEAGSGTSDPAEIIEEVEPASTEPAPAGAGLSPEVIESVVPQVPDGQ